MGSGSGGNTDEEYDGGAYNAGVVCSHWSWRGHWLQQQQHFFHGGYILDYLCILSVLYIFLSFALLTYVSDAKERQQHGKSARSEASLARYPSTSLAEKPMLERRTIRK